MRYQEEQSGLPPEQLRNMQQFDGDDELSTPFGMQLREARRTLKSGEEADGLLITAVAKGSPAAAAGLHAYSHGVHDALAGAAMVGAMVPGGQFAILLIPVLDFMQVGESYDMIIGVDGSRVTNFLDFQDRMRDLQPGEVIYLSVVRDGKRAPGDDAGDGQHPASHQLNRLSLTGRAVPPARVRSANKEALLLLWPSSFLLYAPTCFLYIVESVRRGFSRRDGVERTFGVCSRLDPMSGPGLRVIRALVHSSLL